MAGFSSIGGGGSSAPLAILDVSRSVTTTALGSSPQFMIYTTENADALGIHDTTTGEITIPANIPVGARFEMSYYNLFDGTNTIYTSIHRNTGSGYAAYRYGGPISSASGGTICGVCNPGEKFKLYLERQGGGTITLSGAGDHRYHWMVFKIFAP